jgi:hypothetical protein
LYRLLFSKPLVGELKKGRYVYYHCTGNRGKCPEPYTRQEKLTNEFGQILEELVIPPAVLDWLQSEVAESDRTEQATRQRAIQRPQVRHDQVRARLETTYIDKLEGRITPEFYDRQGGGVAEGAANHSAQDTRDPESCPGTCRSSHRCAGTDEPGVSTVPGTDVGGTAATVAVTRQGSHMAGRRFADIAGRTIRNFTAFEPGKCKKRKGEQRLRAGFGNLAPQENAFRTGSP